MNKHAEKPHVRMPLSGVFECDGPALRFGVLVSVSTIFAVVVMDVLIRRPVVMVRRVAIGVRMPKTARRRNRHQRQPGHKQPGSQPAGTFTKRHRKAHSIVKVEITSSTILRSMDSGFNGQN